MQLVDQFRKLGVRTNADTPEDAAVARQFGAEGIGLFRTEHMFYGAGSDEPLFLLRKMILSETVEERKAALDELAPFVKKSMKATLEAMDALPVTHPAAGTRPLHEFVPQDPKNQKELAESLGIKPAQIKKRGEGLHETNPMMGHRGVRLGITYPEVTEMQIRAIFEAGRRVEKGRSHSEAGVDGPGDLRRARVGRDEGDLRSREKRKSSRPRVSRSIASTARWSRYPARACWPTAWRRRPSSFSFGTNDLTQMSFGFSRDDIGGFLQDYLADNILEADPFQTIDQSGVGQLVEMAVEKGPGDSPRVEDRHLRRAGGRPGERRLLLPHGAELRQLQSVSRADRPPGRRSGLDQGGQIARLLCVLGTIR